MDSKENKNKNQNKSNNSDSKKSKNSHKSFSQKSWNELEEIFEMEPSQMNILQNDITKQKTIPEQIRDYYKVISIDNSNLPFKKKNNMSKIYKSLRGKEKRYINR